MEAKSPSYNRNELCWGNFTLRALTVTKQKTETAGTKRQQNLPYWAGIIVTETAWNIMF